MREGLARCIHASNKQFIHTALYVGRILAKQPGTFTSADLRDRMSIMFPLTVAQDDRVLGSVMRRLAHERVISRTGEYRTSKRSRNHHRPMAVWVGTE